MKYKMTNFEKTIILACVIVTIIAGIAGKFAWDKYQKNMESKNVAIVTVK